MDRGIVVYYLDLSRGDWLRECVSSVWGPEPCIWAQNRSALLAMAETLESRAWEGIRLHTYSRCSVVIRCFVNSHWISMWLRPRGTGVRARTQQWIAHSPSLSHSAAVAAPCNNSASAWPLLSCPWPKEQSEHVE